MEADKIVYGFYVLANHLWFFLKATLLADHEPQPQLV